MGRGLEFEQFVKGVLERSTDIELTASPGTYGPDYGLDFVASRDGRPLLILVKVTTPQTSHRLEEMRTDLDRAAQWYQQLHPGAEPVHVLAFPGVLSESKRTLAARSRVEIWDGQYLRDRAERAGIGVPPYVALGADPGTSSLAATGTGYRHVLLDRLREISPSQAGWPAYEKFCEDVLNFLFVPPLNPAIAQSRDGHGTNRRDYVLPNYAVDGGFWQFMRTHYDAHYVVAEVKNLASSPGKREILQVANYLNPHGTGLFALILARTELNATATWVCREQWIQHNKLIIALDDDDVRQMVESKIAGKDPAELVRQKIEDFRLGI